MKFTELDLTKIPELKWVSPTELRELYLDITKIDGGKTRDKLNDFWGLIRAEIDNFSQLGARPEHQAEFDRIVERYKVAIANVEEQLVASMQRGAEQGRWFALGRRAPDACAEIIPKRYWGFLKLDIQDSTASGGEYRFFGISCMRAEWIPSRHPIIDVISEAQMLERPDLETANTRTIKPNADRPKRKGRGRPTSMAIVRKEFYRRVSQNEIECTITEESHSLADWLARTRPRAKELVAKTIENNLRDEYKEEKNAL